MTRDRTCAWSHATGLSRWSVIGEASCGPGANDETAPTHTGRVRAVARIVHLGLARTRLRGTERRGTPERPGQQFRPRLRYELRGPAR